MQLLERGHILESLAEYAQCSREGDGLLVLVSGEAGVGKSSLIERFTLDVPDARWVSGACDGLFTPRPLGPLFDVAEQLGGELLAAVRAGAGRDELFGALLRELQRSDVLTVLTIEDVHWADESTLDLLRFLGRRIRSAPALLLVTYRDDGLASTDPLRIVLGELASQRSTRRVQVSPLSEHAVKLLAAAGGPRMDAAVLYRLTGGNPFFLTEVLLSPPGEIPPSARDAVLARLARLSEDARRTVEAAALIGQRVEARLLASVGGATLHTLDELVGSGVFVGDEADLRFRHEIIRLAIESGVPAHRRGPVHAGVLAALLEEGSDDNARLAYHAEGAGDREAVLEFAPRAAARAAALASHRESAAQYERALRFAETADVEVVADLYDRLAGEASLIDRWEDSADARVQALVRWRRLGNVLREGDTQRRLSRAMWRLCRGREAFEAAEAAIAILEPLGPTPALGWAYSNLANQRALESQTDAGLADARRAQQLAEEFGLGALSSDALNTEACMLAADGVTEWTPVMRRALAVALEAGADEQAGRAYANLYELLVTEHRFPEAERCYVDGLAFCDEHDMSTYVTCLNGRRGVVLEVTGRWDEAVVLTTRLIDAAASPINQLTPMFSLGRILARRSDPSSWVWLDQGVRLAQTTNEPLWIGLARLARAEAHWLDGSLDEARAETEAAYGSALRSDEWTRGALATWIRRLGLDLPVTGSVAEPYRLSLDGQVAAATAFWEDRGCGYDAALALLDSGDEASLRLALRGFEALGATAGVQAARREMRRIGVRSIPSGSHATTRSHPLGLTGREREVLDLISAGNTNVEISQKLVISVKTVDHHVSAVLAKLGVPSRRLAAATAIRLGLVGSADG